MSLVKSTVGNNSTSHPEKNARANSIIKSSGAALQFKD